MLVTTVLLTLGARRPTYGLLALTVLFPAVVLLASGAHSPAAVYAQAASAQPDLVFPKEAKELGFFSPLSMGIWKPAGDGPFPALIMVHSCQGLGQQIVYWRKLAIERGYVAFVIDSFSSRGAPSCSPPPRKVAPVRAPRALKDVSDAVEHLKTFRFVEKSKIGVLGWSWGAGVALLAASPSFAATGPFPGLPVSAAVSFYPLCHVSPFGDILRQDVAVPALVLMGGRDNETPPDVCLTRLRTLKERNTAAEWHVFENATHCWDCSDMHNVRQPAPPWGSGGEVVYLYDSKVTDQSAERVFDFLSRHFRREPKQ